MWCCCNIITIWGEEGLKSLQIYFLTVLEARSLKSVFPQGWAPFGGSAGVSLLPLPAPGRSSGIYGLVAASLQSLPPSSCGLLHACMSFLSLTRAGPPSPRMTSSYLDYICQDPVSKQGLIYRSWGWGCGHIVFLESLFNPHQGAYSHNISPWRLTVLNQDCGLFLHRPMDLTFVGSKHHSPSDEALVCLLFRVPKFYGLLDGALEATGSVSGRSLVLGFTCWVCCLQSHKDEYQLLWEVRTAVQRKTKGTFIWFIE